MKVGKKKAFDKMSNTFDKLKYGINSNIANRKEKTMFNRMVIKVNNKT